MIPARGWERVGSLLSGPRLYVVYFIRRSSDGKWTSGGKPLGWFAAYRGKSSRGLNVFNIVVWEFGLKIGWEYAKRKP